jgi:dTDP-4-amino-4,6-dideoxygalactose transaminase
VRVPLADLAAQHASIRSEIDGAVSGVLESGDFILGDPVARFEAAFAAWVGSAAAIGVGNGTDAVEIALRAAGVEPGDDVLLPANTFVASAIGCLRAGARPVFADCEEGSFLIDLGDAGPRLTPKTRAILPVHLFGRLAEPSALRAFAREHGLLLVEDAAQAHGARWGEDRAGAIGEAAAWSFYPSKNLGAAGDGGAVTAASSETAQRARALRNYGSIHKNEHPVFGFNSRLDALQAAILEVKLRHIDAWNDRRRRLAAAYRERLAGIGGVVLPEDPGAQRHVWHRFVVRVPQRDSVLERLRAAGIGAAIHYPTPVPFLGAFASTGAARAGDFPVAERLAAEVLSLPIYPEMTESQLGEVCEALADALGAGARALRAARTPGRNA